MLTLKRAMASIMAMGEGLAGGAGYDHSCLQVGCQLLDTAQAFSVSAFVVGGYRKSHCGSSHDGGFEASSKRCRL